MARVDIAPRLGRSACVFTCSVTSMLSNVVYPKLASLQLGCSTVICRPPRGKLPYCVRYLLDTSRVTAHMVCGHHTSMAIHSFAQGHQQITRAVSGVADCASGNLEELVACIVTLRGVGASWFLDFCVVVTQPCMGPLLAQGRARFWQCSD